jgi:hypothetical protein
LVAGERVPDRTEQEAAFAETRVFALLELKNQDPLQWARHVLALPLPYDQATAPWVLRPLVARVFACLRAAGIAEEQLAAACQALELEFPVNDLVAFPAPASKAQNKDSEYKP